MRLCLILAIVLLGRGAAGQTVVEMDLPSARQLLQNHHMDAAVDILTKVTTNYRQSTNIRVQSHRQRHELALLAKALRTDFDGSGNSYIPELTIWKVFAKTGGQVFLASSQIDRGAILLTTDLDYLKGMVAYEILFRLRSGAIRLDEARRNALAVGIEMQIQELGEGQRTISFFGHSNSDDQIVGKLAVIEPPDFVWP